MPSYYDTSYPFTTNASGATQSSGPHLTLRTAANQTVCMVKGIYAGARSSTAGGGVLRVMTLGTATSSSGSTVVAAKRHANSASASTSALSSQTGPGSAPTSRLSVGFAQTGGMGGWVAIEPDAAIMLLPNGGANGNMDVNSYANSASIVADLTVEFSE